MARTAIADLQSKIGERVEVRGWVNAVRDQKRVQFVIVRDPTGMAQAVLGKDEEPSALNDCVSALTPESAVSVTGTVVADERVKLGGIEVQIETLDIVTPPAPETARSRRDSGARQTHGLALHRPASPRSER